MKRSTIIIVLFTAATMLVCVYEGWKLWGLWGVLIAIPIGAISALAIKTFDPQR